MGAELRGAPDLSIILLGVVLASSCASPPPSAPSVNQVAGAWQANSTLVAASGGECVGATLQGVLGRRDTFLAAIAGEGSLDATITSQGNGTSCEYGGTVVNGVIGLNMITCHTSRVLDVRCSSGDLRDVQLVSGNIAAQANGQLGTGAGTDQSTWNVFVSGTSTSVGTLNVTASFTWLFLGLPASNYHVFTGTIFPGYADGTISIPANPNPWCNPCGWFY
jgi:hypothetical protein